MITVEEELRECQVIGDVGGRLRSNEFRSNEFRHGFEELMILE